MKINESLSAETRFYYNCTNKIYQYPKFNKSKNDANNVMITTTPEALSDLRAHEVFPGLAVPLVVVSFSIGQVSLHRLGLTTR
jgi:hypothetical protein